MNSRNQFPIAKEQGSGFQAKEAGFLAVPTPDTEPDANLKA